MKVTEEKDGKATVQTPKYTVEFNEDNSQFKVLDCDGKVVMNSWGDPHLEFNDTKGDCKDEYKADYKEDMSVELDDGTKITVHTVGGGRNGTTYGSEVTITNGGEAVVVSGLKEGGSDGKLRVEDHERGGRRIDRETDDGANTFSFYGGQWHNEAGEIIGSNDKLKQEIREGEAGYDWDGKVS